MPQGNEQFNSPEAVYTARTLGSVSDTFTLPSNYSSSILSSDKLAFPSGGIVTTNTLDELRKIVNQGFVDFKDETENLQAQITDNNTDFTEVNTNLAEIENDFQKVLYDSQNKAWDTIVLNAGTGLSGGGNLKDDRTFNLNVATSGEIGGVLEGGDIDISDTGIMTIKADAVALGTDTTGDYIKNITATTADGVTLTGGTGEQTTTDLKLTERIEASTKGSSVNSDAGFATTNGKVTKVKVPKITYNKFGQLTEVTEMDVNSANDVKVTLKKTDTDTGLVISGGSSDSFTVNASNDKEISFAHALTAGNVGALTTSGATSGTFTQEGTNITQSDATRLIIDSISRDKYGHVTEVKTRGLTYGMSSNNRHGGNTFYTGDAFDIHVPRESDFKSLNTNFETFKTSVINTFSNIANDGDSSLSLTQNLSTAGSISSAGNLVVGGGDPISLPALFVNATTDSVGMGITPDNQSVLELYKTNGVTAGVPYLNSTEVKPILAIRHAVDGESAGGKFGIRFSGWSTGSGSQSGRDFVNRQSGIYASIDSKFSNKIGLAFHTGNNLLTEPGGVERMKLTDAGSSGRLGINNSAPTHSLTVDGNVKFNTGNDNKDHVTFSDGKVTIFDDEDSNIEHLAVGRTSAEKITLGVKDLQNVITAYQDTDSNSDHQFIINRDFSGTGRSDFQIRNKGTNQFVIDKDGKVGIGTSTPAKRLDVNGSINTNSNLTVGGDVTVDGSIGITAGQLLADEWKYAGGNAVANHEVREARIKISLTSAPSVSKHYVKLFTDESTINSYAYITLHRANDYGITSAKGSPVHHAVYSNRLANKTASSTGATFYHKHEGHVGDVNISDQAYIVFTKNSSTNKYCAYLVCEDYFEGFIKIEYHKKGREDSSGIDIVTSSTATSSLATNDVAVYTTQVKTSGTHPFNSIFTQPNWELKAGNITTAALTTTTLTATTDITTPHIVTDAITTNGNIVLPNHRTHDNGEVTPVIRNTGTTAPNTTDNGTSDGFTISQRDYRRGTTNNYWFGKNLDYLIFEKTDANDGGDGGILFTMTGNDNIEREKLRIKTTKVTSSVDLQAPSLIATADLNIGSNALFVDGSEDEVFIQCEDDLRTTGSNGTSSRLMIGGGTRGTTDTFGAIEIVPNSSSGNRHGDVNNHSEGTRLYKTLVTHDKDYGGTAPIGVCKITMPKGFSATMMQIKIKGFSYLVQSNTSDRYGAWELRIGGYNFDDTSNDANDKWAGASADLSGDAPFKEVRLAYDGSKCCILLGSDTTQWARFGNQIVVDELITNWIGTTGWGTGWKIEDIDVEGNLSGTIEKVLDLTDEVNALRKRTHGGKSNIGIGTDSPNEKLEVRGNLKLYADTDGRQLKITSKAGSLNRILMGNQNSDGANKPGIIQSSNGHITFGKGSSWSGHGGTMTTNVTFLQSGKAVFNGRIGIGKTPETNPNNMLAIKGGQIEIVNSDSSKGAQLSSDGALELFRNDSTNTSAEHGFIDFKAAATDDKITRIACRKDVDDSIGGMGAGSLFFGVGDTTAHGTMTIDAATGNMGIGLKPYGTGSGANTIKPLGRLHLQTRAEDCVLILESDTANSDERNNPKILFRQDGGHIFSSISNGFQEELATNNALVLANGGMSGTTGGIIFRTGGPNSGGTLQGDLATAHVANSVERMRIASDGKVGIGTSAPQSTLDVDGTIRSTGSIFGEDAVFGGDATVSGKINTSRVETGSFKMTSADLVIYNRARAGNKVDGEGNQVNHSGRALVHLGGDKLTLNYDTDFSGGTLIQGTTDSNAAIRISSTGGTSEFKHTIQTKTINNKVGDALFINSASSGGSQVRIQNDNDGSVDLVTGGGSVGIGTANPMAKLDVRGLLRSRGFMIDNMSAGGSSQHNILYNAAYRYTVSVSGGYVHDSESATPSGGNSTIGAYDTKDEQNSWFNGTLVPKYSTRHWPDDNSLTSDATHAAAEGTPRGGDFSSNPIVIEITDLPSNHIQRLGYVGFSSRYWFPLRFKVEVYNVYKESAFFNQYQEVLGPGGESYADKDYPYVNQSSWFGLVGNDAGGNPAGTFTRLRITIYKASTYTRRDREQGRIGISEIFMIHPEIARPYNGFLPKTIFEGGRVSTPTTAQPNPPTKMGIGTSDPQALVDISNPDFGSDSQATNENISRNYPLRISNREWLSNMVTGIEFVNGATQKSVPTSRIISKMDGGGSGGEVMKFQTQPSSTTNPNPNQPTTKLELGSNGENKFFGQLIIKGGNAFTTPVLHTIHTGTNTIDFRQSNVYILTMPSTLGSSPTLDALTSVITNSAGHTFTILLKNNSTRNLNYSGDFQWIGEVPTHSTSGTDVISGVCDGSKYFLTLVKDQPDIPAFSTIYNIGQGTSDNRVRSAQDLPSGESALDSALWPDATALKVVHDGNSRDWAAHINKYPMFASITTRRANSNFRIIANVYGGVQGDDTCAITISYNTGSYSQGTVPTGLQETGIVGDDESSTNYSGHTFPMQRDRNTQDRQIEHGNANHLWVPAAGIAAGTTINFFLSLFGMNNVDDRIMFNAPYADAISTKVSGVYVSNIMVEEIYTQ